MSLKSMMICERRQQGVTIRDGLIGAGVMLGASLLLTILVTAARRYGLVVTSDVLRDFSFVGPFTLSMPFWLMKGQPWKAQVVIVGGTFALLVLIGYL